MKKKKGSKIYALMLTIVCIVSMYGVVSAFTTEDFNYESRFPNDRYRTEYSQRKTDASSGYAYYGNGSASYINVEMWGSDGSSGDYQNFTYPHTEGNLTGVKYYKIPLGEARLLLNTVYEYYNKSCYSTLVIYSYGTGQVTGKWSAMTN